MKTLLEHMRCRKISTAQLAKLLDVSVSQIYTWNRKGISKNNKHFRKLKELIPEVQPKEERITAKGEEDKRYKAGTKKKKLVLTDTDIPSYVEPEFESSLFPKIKFK